MRMKPVPKVILILAIVGGIGYGVNLFIENRKANAPAVEVTKPVEAVPQGTQAPAHGQPIEEAAPAPAPRATQSAPQDRGLSNLLGK